jgi:hypothetical protein
VQGSLLFYWLLNKRINCDVQAGRAGTESFTLLTACVPGIVMIIVSARPTPKNQAKALLFSFVCQAISLHLLLFSQSITLLS